MTSEETIRTKRIPPQLAKAILDRLDEQDATNPRKDRRANKRIPYRRMDVMAHITQPGGGTVECCVPTRDLHENGIGFLHGTYLHKGTECRLRLRKRNGDEQIVTGNVAWCRLATAPYHLIGLRFKSPIVPKLFVDPSDRVTGGAETVRETSLAGKVLHVDDQELDRKLFELQFRGTAVQVVGVASQTDAIVQLNRSGFDVVVCDLPQNTRNVGDAIQLLRRAGFAGPIVLLTAETNALRLAAAQRAGIAATVSKPYDRTTLFRVLSTWLSTGDPVAEERIHSQLAGDPQMAPLIENYINEVHASIRKLHAALDAGDLSQVRSICHHLKANGAGFGFPQVSSAAMEAAKVLDAHRSLSQASVELKHLESICRRLATGQPASNTA